MDRHRLAEERSIELHREVAARLRADPGVVDAARARVRSWLATGEVAGPYAAEWQLVLGLPTEDLCACLVDPGERARAMRQCTPFARVVDPRARWRIWRAVAEREGIAR